MFALEPFSQGSLLRRYPTDPITQGGVCVALCDYWLSLIKADYAVPAADRLRQLQHNFPVVIRHQRHYANLRAQHGREEGRRKLGQKLGLDYDPDKTLVERRFVRMEGIRKKIAADIGVVGTGATWTLRFADGSGHAISGFCGIAGQEPILTMRLHLFDPNIGEYGGQLSELDDMLQDLFTRFPFYQSIVALHRATEG